MKISLIVQARMNSSRLPGKVLRGVLGKPLLEFELERLGRSQRVDEIVVATSLSPADDPIAEFCRSKGVIFFRGSEEDVLARFYQVAQVRKSEALVRVCADCPLIDPEVVDKTINYFLKEQGRLDYVSNVMPRTYPRGMDCEVFTAKALTEAHANARETSEREHVTPYFYKHPEIFRLGSVTQEVDESRYRWTVDTEKDFLLIEKILAELYPQNPCFTKQDVIQQLCKHPQWQEINRSIQQKTI